MGRDDIKRGPMSMAALPVRLQRRIEGGLDPVVIFRELVEIPCVTFSEYQLYRYLHSEWGKIQRGLNDTQQERLTVGFTAAGQLLVRWRGRPGDKRRTILIAHVDQEGLLVRSFNPTTQLAKCWHTSAQVPEQHVSKGNGKGSPVKLICTDRTLYGSVVAASKIQGEISATNPFDHEVLVRVERQEHKPNSLILKNDSFMGVGHFDIPPWSHVDG